MSSPPIIVYNALKMLHAYCCPSFDMVTVAFGYLMKGYRDGSQCVGQLVASSTIT